MCHPTTSKRIRYIWYDLRIYFEKKITRNNGKEVMFVTDQYFEASIKGGERERSATTGQIRVTPNRQVDLFF